MSVTYTSVLPVRNETVDFLAGLLAAERLRRGTRANAERGNALLKTTFRALRNVSVDPWRIGRIVAAATVLLHFDHARTT